MVHLFGYEKGGNKLNNSILIDFLNQLSKDLPSETLEWNRDFVIGKCEDIQD